MVVMLGMIVILAVNYLSLIKSKGCQGAVSSFGLDEVVPFMQDAIKNDDIEDNMPKLGSGQNNIAAITGLLDANVQGVDLKEAQAVNAQSNAQRAEPAQSISQRAESESLIDTTLDSSSC
eukprot:gb/GEZN01008640.1/.p2 GENE.gb/GEZN01008640.1/~~gb/GEZN01008640.1/.p2  ORF type:complete len:120 (-),score=16.10 gb/GEZN01008640.1/:27-386(-)